MRILALIELEVGKDALDDAEARQNADATMQMVGNEIRDVLTDLADPDHFPPGHTGPRILAARPRTMLNHEFDAAPQERTQLLAKWAGQTLLEHNPELLALSIVPIWREDGFGKGSPPAVLVAGKNEESVTVTIRTAAALAGALSFLTQPLPKLVSSLLRQVVDGLRQAKETMSPEKAPDDRTPTAEIRGEQPA